MSALFFPIFGHYAPIPEGFALPEPAAETRNLGWASVRIGASGLAQGPVLRRYRDGRVTVDAAGRQITGLPVGGTAPKGWWAGLLN